jgi:hypothetical protein
MGTSLVDLIAPTVLNASDQAANIEAINTFMLTTQPLGNKAQSLRDDWMQWYGGLTWFQKNLESNTQAEAFNRRNAYMRANTDSADELERVNNFIKNAPAFDPVTGKPNLVTSTGDRVINPEPLIPTSYKVIGIATAVGIATLALLKKIRLI